MLCYFEPDDFGNDATKVGSLPSKADNEATNATLANKKAYSFISTQQSKCCCLSNHQNEAFNYETIYLSDGRPNQLCSTVTGKFPLHLKKSNQRQIHHSKSNQHFINFPKQIVELHVCDL